MSRRVYEIAFQIGGKVSKTLNRSMMTAGGQLDQLGRKISEMEKSQGNVTRFRGLHREIDQTRIKLTQAEQEMNGLRRQMQSTDKPTKALTDRFNAAERRVEALRGTLRGQQTELRSTRNEMKNAGVSVNSLARDNERLTRNIQAATRAQQQLREVQGSIAANQQRRGQLRGQLMGAAALAATVAAPARAAMIEQDAMIRLRTVINADDQAGAMAEARSTARQLARSGIVGLQEGFDIQYALNSAGLEAEAANAAARVVASVAKVTSGAPEQVSEIIATTYNNLGKQLEGTTDEQMERIGDLLTKVQLKYQIRDFNQLGESMKYAGSAMAGFNVDMEHGVAVVGALNTAGLQGSQAGTAFNAMMAKMSAATAELGTEMVRGADGTLNLAETLRGVDNAMADMSIDQRANELQRMFGQQGARAMIPLLNNMDDLGAAIKDVSENSRGLVDREIGQFLESTSGQMAALRGSAVVLGATLGSILLPGINGIIGPLATGANYVASLAEQFPMATKVIVGATAALIALRVATIAGAYAGTFLVGGFLQVRKVLLMARTAWLLYNSGVMASTVAAKSAVISTKAVAAATWLFNAALLANPIFWVVGAIAALVAAGVLLWKNWDTIKEKAGQLWDWMGGSVTGVLKNITSALLKFNPLSIFLRAFNRVFEYVTGINLFEAGKSIIASLVNGIRSRVAQLWEWMGGSTDGVVKSIAMALLKFNPVAIFLGSFNKVFEYLTGINLFDAGKAIIMTMVEGIKSKIGAIPDMIRGALSSAREYLPFSDAKRGPFSDLTASGASIISTLAQGIQKTASDALTGPLGERMGIPGTGQGLQSAGRGLNGGGGGMNVTYSPQINLPAGSPAETKKAAQDALTEGNRDLERRLRAIYEERDRLSYA